MSRLICLFSLLIFIQNINAGGSWNFRKRPKILAVEENVHCEEAPIMPVSKPFPLFERLCDDVNFFILDYLDYASCLNLRCASKAALERYSESLKRKVEYGFWRKYISDDFDLVRDNRLGVFYIHKRIGPIFDTALDKILNYTKNKRKLTRKDLPFSFLTAVKLILDCEPPSHNSNAPIVDQLLYCKLVTIEEIDIHDAEDIFRICLYYDLKTLAFATFLRIKKERMLCERQARKLLFWLLLIFYRMKRWYTVRLVCYLMDRFGYMIDFFERQRLKFDFFGFYNPKGILHDILTKLQFYEYHYRYYNDS